MCVGTEGGGEGGGASSCCWCSVFACHRRVWRARFILHGQLPVSTSPAFIIMNHLGLAGNEDCQRGLLGLIISRRTYKLCELCLNNGAGPLFGRRQKGAG